MSQAPPDNPRVVFDCNVMIQAMANKLGPSGQALDLLEQNRIRAFLSRATLRELRLVLAYPEVRSKLPTLTDQIAESFLHRVLYRATFLRPVPHVFDYHLPIKMSHISICVPRAGADFLVTRDRDLLSLADDHSLEAKQFRRLLPTLQICKPEEFLLAVVP